MPGQTVLSHRTLDPATLATSAYAAQINGTHFEISVAGPTRR